jgi:hypothetical protein
LGKGCQLAFQLREDLAEVGCMDLLGCRKRGEQVGNALVAFLRGALTEGVVVQIDAGFGLACGLHGRDGGRVGRGTSGQPGGKGGPGGGGLQQAAPAQGRRILCANQRSEQRSAGRHGNLLRVNACIERLAVAAGCDLDQEA